MIKKLLIIVFLVLCVFNLNAKESIIKAAKSEIDRSMNELKSQENPPYYISYSITDVQSATLISSFGKIKSENEDDKRILDIDVRVGDHNLDNTHIIRGNPFQFGSVGGSVTLPLDDNMPAMRNAIWYNTDLRYKAAIERYEKVLTNKAVKVAEEDTSADFSKEEPQKYYGEQKGFTVDIDKWKAFINRLSAKFNSNPLIYRNQVVFDTEIQNKHFINSDGSELDWFETNVRLYVTAMTKADDGMSLPLYESYFAFTPEGLPDFEKIAADIDKMIDKLMKLREAPMMSTFTGPAMLSGEASGVFFHEIFGHRVEGHREKDPNSSQTFKQSIGKEILPNFIDVVFDPTRKILEDQELSGYYVYDDEGVKSQKVITVEDGTFQSFLMSRSPIEGFDHSNGHGRKQAGYNAVSRQSNLIVFSEEKTAVAELKEMLREEAKEQGKEFGLYFEEVSGGFTFTARTIPNAFNVTPLVVYKIFADGRPDELVRGVDLIGTPLATFANIIATGDDMGIFNGICGAESGGVPVSACSPSILVSTIEVQKKQKSQAKPPILGNPTIENN
jgi:predicted Zn-dependent protease